jgi:hypothetical protein
MGDTKAIARPTLNLASDMATHAALSRIPPIDFQKNFALAAAAGRGMSSMLRDVVTLRFGPGRLTSNEYYYYRLWEAGLSDATKRSVIGKLAQHPMHLACNKLEWKAAAADKLLFHSIMTGAGLPVPDLLAVAHPTRSLPKTPALKTRRDIAGFLRHTAHYPLFAKPIQGKYSLAVISADNISGETINLRGSADIATVDDVAEAMSDTTDGFLIQRRLEPAAEIAAAFGDRLWSIRFLIILTAAGPLLHRATTKIPTGTNPADNYWRPGNLLGALDSETGRIERVVTGSADTLRTVSDHPNTGVAVVGAMIPHWSETVDLVTTAALLLPGIGTQSWDVAVASTGGVLLEVNFGGDLNLSQLASGRGTLDDTFREHLARHGYRGRLE